MARANSRTNQTNKKAVAKNTATAQEKQSIFTKIFGRKKKKPKLRKNVSQNIPNGTLIITNDKYFYGTDGKSDKTRMATVVDSNRQDELGIVKYTKSKIHGEEFENDKGFKGYGDKIYTLDNEQNPIKLGNEKFQKGRAKRAITEKQANEIKRKNIKESRYKAGNRANLRNLKGRKKKKKNGS